MGKHVNEGVPANGLPSPGAMEHERDRWDEDETVRERLYETALTLREPTTVATVADRTVEFSGVLSHSAQIATKFRRIRSPVSPDFSG